MSIPDPCPWLFSMHSTLLKLVRATMCELRAKLSGGIEQLLSFRSGHGYVGMAEGVKSQLFLNRRAPQTYKSVTVLDSASYLMLKNVSNTTAFVNTCDQHTDGSTTAPRAFPPPAQGTRSCTTHIGILLPASHPRQVLQTGGRCTGGGGGRTGPAANHPPAICEKLGGGGGVRIWQHPLGCFQALTV